MYLYRIPFLLACMAAASVLAGCASGSFFGDDKPGGPHYRAASTRPPAALREGIGLYNEGDFNGAIRRLSAHEIGASTVSTRVAALKYTAFSYCVTSRPAQCRQAFDKALRLDPSFELTPGEHGHPLWGPVFARAKKERERGD
jgi:hypothetical protein